jgi:hypothetical protein
VKALEAFRRAILLTGRPGVVAAAIEDDFHRFGLVLRHDGRIITGIEASADRFPWATCMEAPEALASLAGARLSANPAALFAHADPRAHCTHLFELAAVAAGHACRGGAGERRLEAEVTDAIAGARTARLFENGAMVLTWRLRGDVIADPAEFAGRRTSSFGARVLAELEPHLAERLLILRRVVQTAGGRSMDIDAFARAADMNRPAVCFSLQPANAGRATRMRGSVRNWASRDALTASLGRRS